MKGDLKQTMHPAVKMRLEDNLLNNAKTMFSCAAVVNSFLTANGESRSIDLRRARGARVWKLNCIICFIVLTKVPSVGLRIMLINLIKHVIKFSFLVVLLV